MEVRQLRKRSRQGAENRQERRRAAGGGLSSVISFIERKGKEAQEGE